jgi:hypothetical protein
VQAGTIFASDPDSRLHKGRAADATFLRSNAMGIFRRYGYVWVTLILFLGSLAGHWTCAWIAYVNEQKAHGQSPRVSEYLLEASRDTLENWQSEFLQLIWQVAGLSLLLYVGSPQSKEGDDRKEEKIDEILKLLDPDHAQEVIKRIDRKYERQ